MAQPIALPLQPGDARHELLGFLCACRWDGDVEGALLALHEAIVNADKHGGGPTRAEAILEDSVLVLRVTDAGPGFDPHRYINVTPDLEAESGRGLWLMSRVASGLDVEHGHDGVSVVIRFEARAAA